MSLRPALEGTGEVARDAVVAHIATDPKNPEEQGRMIRTRRFKYNAYTVEENREELFDLENDPGETRNLAASGEFADAKADMRTRLLAWLENTGDPVVAQL